MATIHWLGAGLSSVPGIRRLAASGTQMVLWNRTLDKAEKALNGMNSTAVAKALDWGALTESIGKGDVVVSMLPATMHRQVADSCLANGAHFVSSSYVSDEMQALSSAAAQKGLCFVNEVGLDPGLDHLMAHVLVHQYMNSEQFDASNAHHFRSYCGGFPKVPNEFKYKFSWSPLGVLKALRSSARWIGGGEIQTTDKPWTSITQYETRLPSGVETFQAYPNRDSIPFKSEYGFAEDWNVQEFVRGTLRLDGWSDAWSEIFQLVENSAGEQGQAALESKSDELWQAYRYDQDEPDRVVLSVELQVTSDGKTTWHQVYCLDAVGNERGSAMARLVSLTSSIAVESVLNGEFSPGVSTAPSNFQIASNWLQRMTDLGESFERVTIV